MYSQSWFMVYPSHIGSHIHVASVHHIYIYDHEQYKYCVKIVKLTVWFLAHNTEHL